VQYLKKSKNRDARNRRDVSNRSRTPATEGTPAREGTPAIAGTKATTVMQAKTMMPATSNSKDGTMTAATARMLTIVLASAGTPTTHDFSEIHEKLIRMAENS
jgi:hypothetical protein